MKKLKKVLGDLAAFFAVVILFVIFDELNDVDQIFWLLLVLGALLFTILGNIKSDIIHQIDNKITYQPCEFVKSFIDADKDERSDPEFNLIMDAIIPFVPQIGMSVTTTRNDGLFISTGKIVEIDWREGVFHCQTEPFKMFSHETVMPTIAFFERLGWQIPPEELTLRESYALWRKDNPNIELN